VRLEGLGQLKKIHSPHRVRNLPACSIVPQPTALPRALTNNFNIFIITEMRELNIDLGTPVLPTKLESAARNRRDRGTCAAGNRPSSESSNGIWDDRR
jgi:hypothetical protein